MVRIPLPPNTSLRVTCKKRIADSQASPPIVVLLLDLDPHRPKRLPPRKSREPGSHARHFCTPKPTENEDDQKESSGGWCPVTGIAGTPPPSSPQIVVVLVVVLLLDLSTVASQSGFRREKAANEGSTQGHFCTPKQTENKDEDENDQKRERRGWCP